MKERVLVTGGAGFLGRHVASTLAQQGHEVTVLDNLSARSSTFDCAPLQRDGIACVEGSILDAGLVRRLVGDHRWVVHFASVVGVEKTISQPVATMRVLEGTMNVMESLTPDHAAVFGSSADVYGLHSHIYDRPIRETDRVLFEDASIGRWIYPKIKSLEEHAMAQSPGRTVNVRIFNSYGPGMDYPGARRVISQFTQRILAREALQISGDGQQKRAFCFYRDTVDGALRALRFADTKAPGFTETMNIGQCEPISILALAERMQSVAIGLGLLDAPLPVVISVPLYSQRFDDSWHRVPDIDKARRLLGFEPRTGLDEGLAVTLAYYQRESRERLKSCS